MPWIISFKINLHFYENSLFSECFKQLKQAPFRRCFLQAKSSASSKHFKQLNQTFYHTFSHLVTFAPNCFYLVAMFPTKQRARCCECMLASEHKPSLAFAVQEFLGLSNPKFFLLRVNIKDILLSYRTRKGTLFSLLYSLT